MIEVDGRVRFRICDGKAGLAIVILKILTMWQPANALLLMLRLNGRLGLYFALIYCVYLTRLIVY